MRSDLLNDLLELTGEHLFLVLVAMAVGNRDRCPAGIFITRHAGAKRWMLGFASVMQTIPSLALFGFLIPIPFIGGIGKRTVDRGTGAVRATADFAAIRSSASSMWIPRSANPRSRWE